MMKFFKNGSSSKWIGYFASRESGSFNTTGQPAAPWLRSEFDADDTNELQLAICGLGYYEVYINGQKLGNHVLDPIPHVYDKHARYVVYDVSRYLKKGRNAVGVVLGAGWLDSYLDDPWLLNKVPWRDLPKMRLEIRKPNGRILLCSDTSWKLTRNGPITRDGLRTGETYDARRELTGWSEPGYDDSAWEPAEVVHGPGGIEEEQTAAPVVITETQELTNPNAKNVYDLGRNIAGIARITVKGEAGAKVILNFAERMAEDGDIDRTAQIFENFDNTFWQCDEYILKGSSEPEVWEPRFTYHGFRYVRVRTEGSVTVQKVEARILHSDFASVGNIHCGCEIINTLQTLTRRSYLSNFVGIPTDCPHREKNGWTGDAELACETGLLNYDSASGYRQWLATMRDCQRPDGEFPGIVPTGGWGFNWWNGPAWDCAAFVIPWNVYIHTEDDTLLRENYDAMKRYLQFLESMSVDGIVQFGLGDWCAQPSKMVDPRLTNTAIYYGIIKIFLAAASRFNEKQDFLRYSKTAGRVKRAFNRTFRNADGTYADGELAGMGAALYFKLTSDEADRRKTLKALVAAVEKCGAKAEFGILGAKYVPRVLAENGYVSLAARFFTQEEHPGWAYWILHDHAVSLHEDWDSASSRNHIMYGDVSAWLFRYPGGFRFSEDKPGFKRLTIQPAILPEWKNFRAEHRGYVCEWECGTDGQARITVTVPTGCAADVILPDGTKNECGEGTHEFKCAVRR